MGWLSICVCGAKSNFDNTKIKKDQKCKHKGDKKNKKSKKHSKESHLDEESLHKSQNDPIEIEKEIVEKKWVNGGTVNYLDDAKSKTDADRQVNPMKIDDLSNDVWLRQVHDQDFDEFHEDTGRSTNESDRETCDIEYDNAVLHSSGASDTAEDEKRVKCTRNEKGNYEEEINLDEFASRSAISGEAEDLSWTSEIEDKRNVAVVKSRHDRNLVERTSSRINFSSKRREKSKAKETKELRNALPPIKKRSCVGTRNSTSTDDEAHKETNKFGFKGTGAPCEQSEIRRKLNSCSFEVRSLEDEKRIGKTRTRREGSMIPRFASFTRQGANSIETDHDQLEIVQNGTSPYDYVAII